MNDSYVDVEELDDAVIVAHAAPVHAPPSRARVRLARRSVVIPQRGSDDRTVVLSRRTSDKTAKRGIGPWLVWGFAGVLAFGAGGVLSSVLSAKRAMPARTEAAPRRTPPRAPVVEHARPTTQPEVKVVSVGDLPVEKRR